MEKDSRRHRLFFGFGRGIETTVIALGMVCLCVLSLSELFCQAYIGQSKDESCIFLNHGLSFYIGIPLLICVLLVSRKVLERINCHVFFMFFALIYVGAGIWIIRNVSSFLRADALEVFTAASEMNSGNYISLGKLGYLSRYPHQLGLVLYERLLMRINSSVKFFFFLNLFQVIMINFVQGRIVSLLSKKDNATVNATVLLSFAFLPQFFFILFVYGLIPGFFFTILALYCMFRYLYNRKIMFFVLSSLFISIACTIRTNYLIAAIAMGIILLLDFFRNRRGTSILYAVIILFCSVSLPKVVVFLFRVESGIDFGEGIPKILWITMGLQDTSETRLGGWYNNYIEQAFSNAGYDSTLATEIGLNDLKERIAEMLASPLYTFRFFYDKFRSTWLDPLFQSVWTGPLEDCEQYVRSRALQNLYGGGELHRVLTSYMNILLATVYLLSFLYLILEKLVFRKRLGYEALFPILFLMGGVIFHLFWETKSQYVYPFVFLLIPLAVMGVFGLGDVLKKKIMQKPWAKAVKTVDFSENPRYNGQNR